MPGWVGKFLATPLEHCETVASFVSSGVREENVTNRPSPTPGDAIHPLREAVFVGLLLLTVSLAGIWFVVFQAREIQELTIRTDLLRTARAAAGLVDGDRHAELAAGGTHLDANHRALLEPLVRFHRGISEIAYLYTLVEREGGLVFILDTAQLSDRLGFDRVMTPSKLGEPYSSDSPEEDAAEIAALRGGRDHVSKTPFRDDFGTFISAVTPVRNAAGEVVAILGADLRIDDILERSAGLETAAWMATGGLSAAALLIGALVFRVRKRLARGEQAAVLALRERARLIERDRRLVSALGQILFHFEAETGRFEWRGECRELLGFSPSEMPATRGELSRLIHPKDSATAFRWEEFTGPDPVIEEFRCRRPDGSEVWTSCRAVVERDDTGRITNVDGVLLDISQRKAFEADLIAAKNAAEAGARAKSDFLAVMSHEIRTPMNGVVGCTNLLLETPLDTQQREFLETIRKCGDSLLHLINDILDFSKMESDKLTLECRPFSLRDCVGEVLELYGLMAAEKSLELISRFKGSGLDWVAGDEVRLRQIVVNLVGNAIKFTSHGDVVVTVDRRPWPGDRTAIGISVRDTGIGIAEEKQKTIFQPFSQADSSTTRRFGGTGLGLAICGRLATLMGGAITVHSQPGRGSDFLVLLPLEEMAPPSPVAWPQTLNGRTALLICSHALLGSQLTDELNECGVTATWSAIPPSSFDSPVSDFIIWDTRLAGADGFIERMRQAAGLRAVRTIGLVAPTIEGPSIGLGFDIVLTKPLRPGQLARTLAAALDGSATTGPASPPATDSDWAAKWPLRILVAEDNATNRKVICHLLQRMGYEPAVVSNGRECVEAAKSGHFDLVLMDVQMPEMDGYEATNQLRNGGSRIWITALTADAMPEDPLRCRIAGMNDYLSKPVRPDALRAAIERCAEALRPQR